MIAEKGRNRTFVDLLLEKQRDQKPKGKISRSDLLGIGTMDHIKDIVNRQRAAVLYYSVAAGFLYAWLILPTKGVVKFHSASLVDTPESNINSNHTDPVPSGTGLLKKLVNSVRDSLGLEFSPCTTIGEDQYLEENSGFLRMVNRHHLLNSSNYSLSSLFSLGSVGGSVASLQGSTRSSSSAQGSTRVVKRQAWKGPSCLHALYTLLLQPFEDYLPAKGTKNSNKRELILVLENDLYLVPFPVLRSASENSEYLCERFSLLAVPNLASLKSGRTRKQDTQDQTVRSLIIGNPKIPANITEHYGWRDIPQAEQEATMVADLLQNQVLLGTNATKEHVLTQLQEAECIHFATHVSWKLSSIVLCPTEVLEPSPTKRLYMTEGLEEDEQTDVSITAELPPLSEFLLSPADLVSLKLNARLVVVSSSHTRNHEGWATSEGLITLVRALLTAGAQAVLVSLWPVPDTATKILLRAFYSALLQGTRAAKALSEAMQTVQHTKHFAHPANWAGFVLIGLNVRLSNKVSGN